MYKGLQEAKNARVIYLDMNAFFASIEQQHNPALRGRPVAVVSHNTPRGTVLASSYEAKAFGLFTGMKVGEAKQRCPHLFIHEGTPFIYRTTHKKFVSILHDLFGPDVRVKSIDEAALFMAPNLQSSEYCWKLARTIKEEFKKHLGEYIRCSIGIAPNQLLAKLATDLQKPDGLVEVTLENTAEKLAPLDLTALPGIAHANASILINHGITSPLELYQTPAADLQRLFGIWGQQWWWRLHGFEPDDGESLRKSISHQHALKQWATGLDEVHGMIYRMVERLIHRLRRNHFQCRTVFLYLNIKGAPHIYQEHHFGAPMSSYTLLTDTIMNMVHCCPSPLPGPLRLISLGFRDLHEAATGLQLDLFHHFAKQESLSNALELIRSRHGFDAIHLGNVIRLDKNVAKEQIGFGRVRDR